MLSKRYYVYILASRKNGTLYVGVTGNLLARIKQHKDGSASKFTKMYGVNRLVYFDETDCISDAVSTEKRLKKWNRAWKIRLIEERNPDWDDLYVG